MEENNPNNEQNKRNVFDVTGFLSQISHDLRVPMNTIIGSTELILHENVSKKVRESVNDIRHAAGVLTCLTEDIIDLIRINNGDFVMESTEYCSEDIVLDIRRLIESRAEETGLEYELDIDRRIPYRMIGDRRRCGEMVEKLLNNAFEFTKNGKVALTIQCLPNGDNSVFLRVNVADSGSGVMSDDIIKVMGGKTWNEELSMRAQEGAATRVFLVRALAELMGGKLTAKSVKDVGTTFTLLVPQKAVGLSTLEDHEEEATLEEKEKSAFSAPEARVLVVEDNAINGRVESGLLRRYGISADVVASGAGALELVKSIRYDLIFMDYVMPDMDGAEVTRTIRGLADQYPDDRDYYIGLPIIALTASVDNDAIAAMISSGMNDSLFKPVSPQALESVLRERLPADKIKEIGTGKIGGSGIALLDKLGLNTRLALENFGGEEEEYKNVLRTMCRSSDTKGKVLNYYLEQHDYKNYIIAIHGILGVAKVIGAEWIENKTQELEKAAKQGLRDVVEKETGILAETYDNLLTSIRAALESEKDDSTKGAIEKEDLRALLEELRGYLEQYQIDEVEELFYSLAQFSYPDHRVMELIHDAEGSMLNYDYNDVLKSVEEILDILK